MKIALLGHGTIGAGVDHIVKDLPDMEVTKILSLVVDAEMEGRTAKSIDDIVSDPEIDTVVEVMGGVHPAYEFIEKAMKAGKNVVTANKAVLAAYYRELTALSKETGVSFRATASVGGGIPWLTSMERLKRTDAVSGFYGIMNGTTNYMLTGMEESLKDPDKAPVSYEEVLSKAQALGYAEKDPTSDVDGLDVRRKVAISANVAFDLVLSEEEIPTFGIRNVKPSDFTEAGKLGASIRLIGSASEDPDDPSSVHASVLPHFVPENGVEAGTIRNFNVFTLVLKRAGALKFYGQGAGRYPTANNVVQDLKDILLSRPGFYTDLFREGKVKAGTKEARFYLRSETPSAYFRSIAARTLSNGAILTKPVPEGEAVAQAMDLRNRDASLFFAKID